MYLDFFNLRELPFELTPNTKFLFHTAQTQEAICTLEYGLSSGKSITVLLGEAGTGKTTLLHAALQSERCKDISCVYLNNPTLTRAEFIQMLSRRFNLSSAAETSKAILLDELTTVLQERLARGQRTALVIDEAQSLSHELLEEVRLLANAETQTEKMLPVVLAGQPELSDRLDEPRLRQLKQRITLRCTVSPYSLEDTAAYIAWRIRTAGGQSEQLFTREAVLAIHQHAAGIPRTIGVICDNALLTAYGLGRKPVDSAIVGEVTHDLDLDAFRSRYAAALHDTERVPDLIGKVPESWW